MGSSGRTHGLLMERDCRQRQTVETVKGMEMVTPNALGGGAPGESGKQFGKILT